MKKQPTVASYKLQTLWYDKALDKWYHMKGTARTYFDTLEQGKQYIDDMGDPLSGIKGCKFEGSK